MRFPKTTNVYEQVGILIPGATLVALLTVSFPEARSQLANTSVSVGAFGILLVVGYASGQLVAALGNVIDLIYWKLWGGVPSTWIVGPRPKLLSSSQLSRLDEIARSELGLTCPPIKDQTAQEWYPISRQIYSFVETTENQ